MSELTEKSFRILELPRVLELLSEKAVSEEAKERCLNLRPETEFAEVQRLLDETDAARDMIGLHGAPSFSGVKPVAESLDRAHRGGSLNTRELLTIAGVLTAARRTRDYYAHTPERNQNRNGESKRDILAPMFYALKGNHFLEEKIKRCIIDEDNISDAASPELSDIRRHMRQAQSKSRQILQKIISSPSYSKILQEAIITQRDGRFVVPVKAEYKSAMPGLTHDISSSGATVFIEPMGVVQANNELIELQAKEQKEIDRILAELSADAADHRGDIQQDYNMLVKLDIIFARGELSYQMDAVRPGLRHDGSIYLKKARHPLLNPKTAVPIDLSLGETFDTLVITGPNTGGKTVSLKTLGLLILMAQCGLHIPAGDQSALSVYHHVLADIGDEQSIEQNLSTFSAHMSNIIYILQEADPDSLLLFDELGAGTDPVEGAALAIAIIQRVRELGAKTAATTHYAELKTFAMTTSGVENASCEFNVETLAPTYKLIIGVPGKSNAFAIAKRLGLPDDLIQDAQSRMSGDNIRFEDILTQLEQKRQLLEKRDMESERLYQQREQDARKAREFREQMEKARDRAKSRGEADAKRILKDARAAADQVFAELDSLRKKQEQALLAGSNINHDNQDINNARADIRRQLNQAQDAFKQFIPEPIPKPSRAIVIGDFVELPGVKTPAEVIGIEKNILRLKAGALNMKIKSDEVRLIEGAERKIAEKNLKNKNSGGVRTPRNPGAARELDIRGLESIEAESVIESFLSSAVMARLETVVIIHGKGTGALRKAVHAVLRKNKAVKNFRLGVYGEGESGVTVVDLK